MSQVQNRSYLLQLDIPGLAEKRPSVLRGDKIYATVSADTTLNIESPSKGSKAIQEYEGVVHEVQETKVLLGFSDKLMRRYLVSSNHDNLNKSYQHKENLVIINNLLLF